MSKNGHATYDEAYAAFDKLENYSATTNIAGFDDACKKYHSEVKPWLDQGLSFFDTTIGKGVLIAFPILAKVVAGIKLLKGLLEQSCKPS